LSALDATPRRELEVRVRRVRGGLMIARRNEVYELNEVAALIWAESDGTKSAREIAVRVAEEFDVDSDTAEHDVCLFVDDLHEKQLVSLTSAG
jgi:Coenzyme PQQ synthesis protein D (PqqD)